MACYGSSATRDAKGVNVEALDALTHLLTQVTGGWLPRAKGRKRETAPAASLSGRGF